MNDPVRCGQCEKSNNIDYTITHGSSTTTCLGWSPVFDRDGNPLNENPNKTTTEYFCSNGHRFLIKE